MPNLSNNGLSGLFIDGKEVKRASLGGKVFFEKHDYDLSLNSDKDILSYYDEDSATLTATLTDYNDPIGGETVLMYDSDNVSLATYYNWLNVFLFTVTSENKGEVIFDTTNAEHNNFYTEDTPSGGGYSNGGRVKFVITDTQVETWRYNSSTDTWTKSMMLYNLPVKIGFSYGTEVISNTAKIPFFAMGITDSHGECSVVYDSKGTGDLNIKCECMNLQETYELEDCIIYDESEYSWVSGTSETFHDMYPLFDFDANNDFELYIDFHQNSALGTVGLNPVNQGTTVKYHLNYGQSQAGTALYWGNSGGTETAQRHSESGKINQWLSMKFIKIGEIISIYRNNIFYDSVTNSEVGKHGNMNIGVTSWSTSKTLKVKNLKLKPL